MPVACRAEHVGWLGTAACGGEGVCPYPLPSGAFSQSELKEQKKIGGAKACGLRRGALCMASRPPLSTKTGSYEKPLSLMLEAVERLFQVFVVEFEVL